MDYFLFISLVSMTCVMYRPARSEVFRSMEFPAPFFFAGKRLINHAIKIISVLDMGLCELMCYQEPNCVSFNFRKNPDNGEVKHSCELNNSTHLEHDSEFKDDPSYFYRGAKNACGNNLCRNNGSCQSGFTEKGYQCVCLSGFGGHHCEKGCPANWVASRVSCYYIANTTFTTMKDARKKCRDMKADLPIINSAEENTFIADFLKKQASKPAWIGLRRNTSDSKFYWVDGTPIEGNYDAWRAGEPNNNNDNENCALITVEPIHGVWNDIPCEESWAANLCQKAMQEN